MKNNILLKNNLKFTLLLILINLTGLFIFIGKKDQFTVFSIIINFCLFFLYKINLSQLLNNYRQKIKKELFYINYPLLISVFFIFIFLTLITNIIIINSVNKEALSSAAVLTFFASTITMLLPSLIFLIYIFIVTPAFVIPSLEKKKSNKIINILLFCLFLIFLLFYMFKFISDAVDNLNINKKDKFKVSKLVITYSDKYLKYKDLTDERIKILSHDKVKVPLYYTSFGYKYKTYEEAENFCKSINARVPNHYEIYNIIFNKFNTLGEQYYWTSNYAGKYNLILHFNNMSYDIKIKPQNITPVLYCVANASTELKSKDKKYFYRIIPIKQENAIKQKNSKEFKFPPDINQIKTVMDNKFDKTQQVIQKMPPDVNFSVQHVSEDIFNKLLEEGYNYNKESRANSYYEATESTIYKKINGNSDIKKINLCYFPFTDYSNLTKQNQTELWKQSFCSPSFEVIQETPVIKSGYEKAAYCMANGGRIPNIPELTAILRKYGLNHTQEQYWTSTELINSATREKQPVTIEYKDSNFILPKIRDKSVKAYVFCIKTSKQSKIISNYKSRFYNEDGKYYAQRICPSCVYYEMPDTVLLQ